MKARNGSRNGIWAIILVLIVKWNGLFLGWMLNRRRDFC